MERKILLVDDELPFCRVMRISLADFGFHVTDVHSGEAALEKLHTENADLVLLDVNLPGMSGLETCRAVRAFSSVPIIIVSVRNGQGVKASAFAAGANAYITKPFGMQELLAQIQKTLPE